MAETLGSMQTSQAAKDLYLEIVDEIRCENAWFIAEKHLKAAYERGLKDGQVMANVKRKKR
jgi:hypothetical protein